MLVTSAADRGGQFQVSADLPTVLIGKEAGGPQSRSGRGSEERFLAPAGNYAPGTFLEFTYKMLWYSLL
jgi:hypothetical protein